jgi:hypothetical protein
MLLAPINTAAAGDTTLVAAVAGKVIRVRQLLVVNQVATANNVKLRSGTTDLHAAIPLPLVVGGAIPVDIDGDELQTVAGALLAINLSAATAVTGYVVYSLE